VTDFTLERIAIPAHLDDPDGADFIATDFTATVEVRNATEADGYGTEELSATAAELLPLWHDQEYEPKQLFAARLNGRIVARAIFETRPAAEGNTAWVDVQVHPQFRRRGLGTALADQLETLAIEDHRTNLVVYAVSKAAAGERLRSPTGFGSVPDANAEVRFLLDRGFRLKQVKRASRLALPVVADIVDGLVEQSQQRAGTDYRLHQWSGRTPDRWLDDMALLFTRMSTDTPNAGLAGMTELGVPAEPDRPASQNDTIVLEEHRGHRLGMLLKAANIRHLQSTAPGHPSIITFNAEENRYMIEVNEAVGFLAVGCEGAWKKNLAPS